MWVFWSSIVWFSAFWNTVLRNFRIIEKGRCMCMSSDWICFFEQSSDKFYAAVLHYKVRAVEAGGERENQILFREKGP